jgi:2-keto-4-pentenoate hydratase/2-oxohepta-3-ene-1,7-dioic acid hydratase in catechol pathway
MRICTFTISGERRDMQRVGVLEDSRIYEVAEKMSMNALIEEGRETRSLETAGSGHDLTKVVLCAPIPRPGKILATIVNTSGMLGGDDITLDRPRIDMKAPSAVIGPHEEIRAPATGIRPEVELAAIVGKRMHRTKAQEASDSLFGYTILNDVTAPSDSRGDAYEAYRRDRGTGAIRKVTLRGPLFRSKNHDTFCPMGPCIATPEENADWANLKMTTKFDDELVQDGSTAEYIFTPASIASYISGFLTLEPGDVVSCGSVGWTPAVLGKLDPTEFVLPSRNGMLELEIEGVGKLRNPVSMESVE